MVIVIIASLAALLFPVFAKARELSCASHLKPLDPGSKSAQGARISLPNRKQLQMQKFKQHAWSAKTATFAALITLLAVLSVDSPQPASAIGAGDADAAIRAFNHAFLVTSRDSAYYKSSLSKSAEDGTWTASLDIMGEEDAYERTGSAADRALVNNLCATWLKNTPPPWTWDGWNDDIGWFSLALIRGYQITGNPVFLTQAEYGFNIA